MRGLDLLLLEILTVGLQSESFSKYLFTRTLAHTSGVSGLFLCLSLPRSFLHIPSLCFELLVPHRMQDTEARMYVFKLRHFYDNMTVISM
jgi:hypothetical protein